MPYRTVAPSLFLLLTLSACGSPSPNGPSDAGGDEADAGIELPDAGPTWPAEDGCLKAEPEALAFEATTACTARGTFQLSNTCAHEIRLRKVAVADPTPANFYLTASPAIPEAGYPLTPGATVPVEVKFRPQSAGTATASLQVDWTSADEARVLSATLTGTATEGAWQLDTAQAPPLPKKDFLLVFDNGPTLEQQRANIRTNLAFFAKYLHFTSEDVHVAVTTTAGTGATARAELVPEGAGTFLQATDADFEARMVALFDSMTTGPSAHDGLATAADALEPTHLATEAPGYWRDEARLAVVIITDHADRSPLAVADYLDPIIDRKLRPFLVTIAVIAGFSDLSCGVEADDGRYGAAAIATFGLRDDLCAIDWERTLESIECTDCYWGLIALPLTQIPDISRIDEFEVRIDGVEIDRIDSHGAELWTYDAWRNEIQFPPLLSPEPGQAATVRYPLAECLTP